MRRIISHLCVLAALGVLAGCASSDERQWLKLNGKYTKEEFQRDHKECTKSGKLDDACMRSRGWVAVNPLGKPETPQVREVRPPAGRY